MIFFLIRGMEEGEENEEEGKILAILNNPSQGLERCSPHSESDLARLT
jgi:hypothetical protein